MATRKTDKIGDLGEKIGGARKDMGIKLGPRGSAPKPVVDDPRPAWMRRYVVAPELERNRQTGQTVETGRWSVLDTERKGYGGHPSVARGLPSKEAAERTIPLAAVARNHRVRPVTVGQGQTAWEIWRQVTDRKQVRVTPESFPTRESAMEHMANNAAKIIETKTSFGEEILARPEKVFRAGPQYRKADVPGEAFRSTFGFRGVEFGNWQNQLERQQLMNHAYDGMHDLAQITGLTPKALSLNEQLGLAFGARGHGLSGARAHYERDYGAINLTKMKGAGSLAHEWWHAVDHFLGRTDDPSLNETVTNTSGHKVFKTDGRGDDFISHRVVNPYAKGKLNEGVRAAYKNLIDTIYTKEEKYTEDRAKVEKFAAGSQMDVEKQIAAIRRNMEEKQEYGKRFVDPATPEQLAKVNKTLGIATLIGAPVAAALVAYDATKSTAQAAGQGDATLSAMKAAGVAGGVAAGVGYGIVKGVQLGVRGLTAVAPIAGKAVARLLPGAGVALMSYGAWSGYQKHGLKGAALGAIGADAVLDIGKAGPQRLSPEQRQQFQVANQAHSAMQQSSNGEVRSFERDRRAPSGVVVHETVKAHRRSSKAA